MVLTSGTDFNAFKVFDHFRQKLEEYIFPQVGKITVSIGIVKISEKENPTTVLEHADKALYYSKEHGRNQVSDYHELIDQGKLTTKTINNDIELF